MNSQFGLAYLRRGQDDKAGEYAEKAIPWTENLSPGVHSMNNGIAAVVDVCFG
jgi:hypothetical protein